MHDRQCPKCGFTQEDQKQCLNCGLIFAKYLQRQESLQPAPTSFPGGLAAIWREDGHRELRYRLLVLPAALLVAYLAVGSQLQHLVRIFLSMWVHEAGHAVTAWLCGFGAFPGPWRTPVSEERVTAVTVVLAGALLWWVYRAWREGRWLPVAGGLVLLVVQILCTRLPETRADALIIFGGDAGCLVLGTVLMATFYAPRESVIYHGALRWGFVGIGAAAFMDAFSTWWGARSDPGRIPFGENEGVGFSDPTRLVDEFGWSIRDLVDRHVGLALACLAILALIYLAGIYREAGK